jgi:hypothetical protein
MALAKQACRIIVAAIHERRPYTVQELEVLSRANRLLEAA